MYSHEFVSIGRVPFSKIRVLYISFRLFLVIFIKEFVMITIVKWLVTALLAGFAWLVGNYTVEYFRPYKRN